MVLLFIPKVTIVSYCPIQLLFKTKNILTSIPLPQRNNFEVYIDGTGGSISKIEQRLETTTSTGIVY